MWKLTVTIHAVHDNDDRTIERLFSTEKDAEIAQEVVMFLTRDEEGSEILTCSNIEAA